MWRLPEYHIDNSYVNISMASYHRVTYGIHVLLADHDHKFLASTVDMLKRQFYKVTVVDSANAAISVLNRKEEKFDAVIANIHSPDRQAYKLLRDAVSMDLLVIFLCDEENAEVAVRLIEHGAFALLQKPTCQETLKNLWQHVVRERSMLRAKQMIFMEKTNRELAVINNAVINNGVVGGGSDRGKGVMRVEENENYQMSYRGKGKRSREQSLSEATRMTTTMSQGMSRVKRKTCTEWTVDLHEKFMSAVHQLGDGRCYPKEILELMNVPGLTRMQVASHLQKCRNDNWRAPEERRAPPMSSASPASGSGDPGNSQQLGSIASPEVQSSPSITGAVTGDPSSQPPADRQYLAIGAAAAFVSKLESSSPPSAAVQPAVVATAVGTFTATSGQASIVGSVNYGTGGILQALGCGGSGGSLFRNKDAFTDDPNNNTTAADDSFVTPQPPRIHRRLQSADEFFSFNDVDYEYLIQGFSDNNARQAGVALQAPTHNNTSSSEFNDKAVPVLDCATAAISVLSRKEEKFDEVIANIHSPDMQAYKLLREAVSMDLLVILLCDEEDAEMAVRLIEHGAFLLLHKPICDQLMIC
nr:two-component response regulator ARR14-like [Ipomoea batatas]